MCCVYLGTFTYRATYRCPRPDKSHPRRPSVPGLTDSGRSSARQLRCRSSSCRPTSQATCGRRPRQNGHHCGAGAQADRWRFSFEEQTRIELAVSIKLWLVEELPGANTEGATLEKARANLAEAVAMVLEANRELAEEGVRGQEVIREPLSLGAA